MPTISVIDRTDFATLVRNYEMATADLEASDVETNEEIDFYAAAATGALRDLLRCRVDITGHVLLKLHLVRAEQCFHWDSGEFNQIWDILLEDLKRIEGLSPLPVHTGETQPQ